MPDGFGSVYEYLDSLAAKVPAGSDGLVSINYLQGRFFPPDPAVRGLFVGHTWAHTRMHFYRAILESIAYDHYLTREIIRELLPGLAAGHGHRHRQRGGQRAVDADQGRRAAVPLPEPAAKRPVHPGRRRSSAATPWACSRTWTRSPNVSPAPTARSSLGRGADRPYLRNIQVYRELFERLRPIYRRLAGGDALNPRERFLAVMRFEPGVRAPKAEFGYWTTTLKRFLREGLPVVRSLCRRTCRTTARSAGPSRCGPATGW